VSLCPRPLDPIDAEAVACGAEPVFSADAAAHAAGCPSCGEAVREARDLAAELDRLPPLAGRAPELADRVIRLRPFSRKERRTYALWQGPLVLGGSVGLAGLALLALPGLTTGQQAGLGAALLGPPLALARSIGRWAGQLLSEGPGGLELLSEGLRADQGLALAAALLFVPAALALNRVLARARARR
jgi:hypothetical protein